MKRWRLIVAIPAAAGLSILGATAASASPADTQAAAASPPASSAPAHTPTPSQAVQAPSEGTFYYIGNDETGDDLAVPYSSSGAVEYGYTLLVSLGSAWELVNPITWDFRGTDYTAYQLYADPGCAVADAAGPFIISTCPGADKDSASYFYIGCGSNGLCHINSMYWSDKYDSWQIMYQLFSYTSSESAAGSGTEGDWFFEN